MLVDGNWLINVCIPAKKVPGVGDEYASYLFLQQMMKWRKTVFANRIIVVWDMGIPSFRFDYLPDYKKSRRVAKTKPSDLFRKDMLGKNCEFLGKILPQMGIRSWKVKQIEGDDLLFALVQHLRSQKTIVLSGDMDLAQLVSPTVSLRTNKQLIDLKTLTSITLMDKKLPEVKMRSGADVVAFKAMRGDSSDSISPIIRPKSFTKLWLAMMEKDCPPQPQQILALAKELKIDLDVDSLRNNWYVVDLARAPIAPAMIGEAQMVLNTPQQLHESQVHSMVNEVGMNPSSLADVFTQLRYLKK